MNSLREKAWSRYFLLKMKKYKHSHIDMAIRLNGIAKKIDIEKNRGRWLIYARYARACCPVK
jgi:hypothetical protein